MTISDMSKLYYSISECADMLGESVSTVRYWSNTFERFFSIRRNNKGNRQYVEKDLEVLRRIKYLTRECGMSLDVVATRLSDREDQSDKLLKIRDSLLKIRERLVQIRQTL